MSRVAGPEAARSPGLTAPLRVARVASALAAGLLVALAVLSLAAFVEGFNTGSLAFDFRGAFLSAAHAVLDGESPYPPVEGPALASQTAYVYPPLLAYLVVPFTVFPETAASVLAVIGAAVLLVATLAVLGVRDARCYAAMALWAPTVNALHMASTSVLLAFAAALAWRYRATAWPLATSLGLGVATKIILWPLLVWT
ncbi:MAG: glycosyltransferase 87 family protein, partial [Gaiellaceae bacterium]